jgi:ribosome-associated protein
MEPAERSSEPSSVPTSSSLPEGVPPALERAIELAVDRKARDVVLLDLRSVSDATDFFLIMSGTSDVHVRSIAEHILEELKGEGMRVGHVEGLRGGHWVLLDYFDYVIHVFYPAARDFYQLERLWGDAPEYSIES